MAIVVRRSDKKAAEEKKISDERALRDRVRSNEDKVEMRRKNCFGTKAKPERLTDAQLKKLKAEITGCAKFVKKLRDFKEAHKSGIMSDLNKLKLTKYVSECVQGFVEGVSTIKAADSGAAAIVISALHQRYEGFGHKTDGVVPQLMRIVDGKPNPGKDSAYALCSHCLHCQCSVFALCVPLPLRLRQCLCLVCSTAFAAKTVPLSCVSTAFAAKTVPLPCWFAAIPGA